jgi:catechol 2,3-dioxygenase-like lactoylglutathione lyase family enzyme
MTRAALSPSILSPTITTRRLQETRAFYERHFGSEAVFDCGWYVQLKLSGAVESV